MARESQLDFYDNEVICMCVIGAILREHPRVEVSRAMILPVVFLHDECVQWASRGQVKIRSIEEFVQKKAVFFTHFSSRFYALLPVCMNALLLGLNTNNFVIDTGELALNAESRIHEISTPRIDKIYSAIRKLDFFFSERVENLYGKLKVEI